MKKIGVISFRYETKQNAKEYNKRRLKELSEIKETSESQGITHLVLPGKTFHVSKHYWGNDFFSKDLKKIKYMFKNMSIILEAMYLNNSNQPEYPPVDTGIILIEKGKEVSNRIQQLFASSTIKPRSYMEILYKRFWAENIWEHRLVKLDGINFLIWVCGEINFLENKHNPKNKIVPRFISTSEFNKELKRFDFDILFNPAHTPMGELGKVKNKLKYMSKKGKFAIHTTNIPSSQKSTKNAIFVFKNGREICYKNKLVWDRDKSWTMETIDI